MAWIEVHQNLARHPKLTRLASKLGIHRAQAAGHLTFLWLWLLDYADDGDLSRFDPTEIATAAELPDSLDAASFVAALIECGWVDEDKCVHDWAQYGGKLVEYRKREAERKRQDRLKQNVVLPDGRRRPDPPSAGAAQSGKNPPSIPPDSSPQKPPDSGSTSSTKNVRRPSGGCPPPVRGTSAARTALPYRTVPYRGTTARARERQQQPPDASHQGTEADPPALAGENLSTATQQPTEEEVLAFAASWPGSPAEAIPEKIPVAHALRWYAWRATNKFPADWKSDLTRRFRSRFMEGHSDAKHKAAGDEGSHSNGISSTAREINKEWKIKSEEAALLADVGNPDNGIGTLARKTAALPAFLARKKKLELLKRG